MAWSTPPTQTLGTAISVAVWNRDIVDNTLALKTPPKDIYEANSGGDYSTTSTVFVAVDGTNLSFTPTTQGGDVLVTFIGTFVASASQTLSLTLFVNGSNIYTPGVFRVEQSVSNETRQITWLIEGYTSGQSIELRWKTSGGTITLRRSSSFPPVQMTIKEDR